MKKGNAETRNSNCSNVKKFHQFVKIERGPVNSAIIDLLEGEVFQVSNDVIDKFNKGDHSEIQEFIEVVQDAQLVIDIQPHCWIPEIDMLKDREEEHNELNIELHIEKGVPLRTILESLKNIQISQVYFYGTELPKDYMDNPIIRLKQKNFDKCVEQTSINGDFWKISESIFQFNTCYNSCWGTVIAITADGKIRPCIHSQIEIGHFKHDLEDIDSLLKKMNFYWSFTKDKVERCRDCEFRYVCFDCREIAMRKNGEMAGPNPLCGYNPYTGEWEE